MALVGLFFIAIGLFHLLAPYASWYMSVGWKLRDAEPSDAYLVMTRIGGVIACAVGIIVFIAGLVR